MTVRPAVAADAAAIAAIYNQGIEERTATFRTAPASPSEVAGWLEVGERFPVLVHGEPLLGWARVVGYSPPPFYDGVGEYMLYVARDVRRRGVGRALLEATCERTRQLGYHKLVGKLFTDNTPSIALARSCGFREVGVHRRHGRLDGEWRDVLVVERSLGEPGSPATMAGEPTEAT